MKISRRALLRAGALTTAGAALAGKDLPARTVAPAAWGGDSSPKTAVQQGALPPLPAAFDSLKPLGPRVQPITWEERAGRIALAHRLMHDAKPRIEALYLAPGTSLYYYTGIRWWPSERLLAFLIPREGDPVIICPAFEEGRLRELLPWKEMNVLTWQEDENPNALAAKWLADRSIRTGRVAIEERTFFTFYDGLRKAASHGLEYVLGDAVTAGCRAVKTDHELSLMRLACEATTDVYRAVFASLREGMTQYDVSRMVEQGFARMGLPSESLVLLGKWAAQPHGTREPQNLKEGEIVLIDGGTTVEGYQSDVTRCSLIGKPSDTLRRVFEIVRQAQDAALKAAAFGAFSGAADDAARQVIADAGFGPGYKYFKHRVGHGLGLDGHEHPYLVRGSKTILQTGMTFSNEPGIYVAGEYGLRLEDDMVISEVGAARLLTSGFSPSLEKPLADPEPPEAPAAS